MYLKYLTQIIELVEFLIDILKKSKTMEKLPKVFRQTTFLLKYSGAVLKAKYKFTKKKELCNEFEKNLKDTKKQFDVIKI
jgi:hypothetical protein